MTSRWQPMNSMNSMNNNNNNNNNYNNYNNYNNGHSSLQRQSIRNRNDNNIGNTNYNNYSQQKQQQQQQQQSSYRFESNLQRNNDYYFNNNIRRRRDSDAVSRIKLAISGFFASYPLWIQAIITLIIGFIAYFFYDYASSLNTLQSYLLYKAISFIGFLISVAFLYLLYNNLSKTWNKSRFNLNISSSTSPNMNNMNNRNNNNGNNNNNNMINNQSQQRNENLKNQSISQRDELYFSKKAMDNHLSSTTFNNDNKFDYNSSPIKIASYDPNQIVNEKGLNVFLEKQKQKQQQQQSSLLQTPLTSSIINVKTPIGKAFGSMRMTPAVQPFKTTSIFDTPNKTLDNSFVNIYIYLLIYLSILALIYLFIY